MIDGILNIYKEPGYTSFDVVAKMRGIIKQKKIGHTGTLDPDAEGVLVLCLGNATKLCEMLTDKDKEYTAVLKLGVTTDTEDSSGAVLTEKPVVCNEEEVRDAILSFLGRQEQIPPMYSAIKVNGKKLYELAHKGIEIERTPRPIEIFSLDITSIDLPYATFRICCSKGTYIRSLCRDIGEKLGCGGCMEHLTRNRVSQFTEETALTLAQVEELRDKGELEKQIMPIDSLFPNYTKLTVTETANKYLYNGNPLTLNSFNASDLYEFEHNESVFMYDSEGSLKGLYQYDEKKKRFLPDKMFLSQ